jgi:hypothetical protein
LFLRNSERETAYTFAGIALGCSDDLTAWDSQRLANQIQR